MGNLKQPLHKLLKRQLSQTTGNDAVLESEVVKNLLDKINQTYFDADKERYWLEQSLTITSQEMAELYEKLATDSQARIKAISSALPDMLFFVDQQQRVLEAFGDHVFTDLVKGSFAVELDVAHYFIDALAAELSAQLQTVFTGQEATIFNFDLSVDGQDRHYEVRLIKTDIVINGVRSAIGLIRDVSEEIEKQHQASLVSRIMAYSKEAVVVYDHHGLVTFFNQAFEDLFGGTQELTIGSRFDFLQFAVHEGFSEGVWQQINQTGIWKGEWQITGREAVCNLNMQFEKVQLDLGQTYMIAVINDITELQYSRDELMHVAYHDFLTGLPNRKFYYEELCSKLKSLSSECMGAVLFFDLDRFKVVNDSLGHRIGDELLIAVTHRLSRSLRSNEFLSRMGGDEFTVIKFDCENHAEIEACAQRILTAFDLPFQVDQHEIEIKTSVGISTYPDDSVDVDDLTQFADTAMYHAKSQGGNDFKYFSQSQQTSVLQKFKMEQELRKAINQNQLMLYYQPQISTEGAQVVSLEALCRWRFDGTFISPEVFVSIAEVTGLINDLGMWTLTTACEQFSTWLAQGVALQRIAVNVSRVQLSDPNFSQQVISCLNKHKLSGHFLEFEVTENALMTNNQAAKSNIEQLHEAGIRWAVDDFGTGHSSLSNLRQYPFKLIKIDKSFVAGIGRGADDEVIIKTTMAMAKELGLEVVAEGVETSEQAAFLKAIGCQLQQGFYYAKPTPVGRLQLPTEASVSLA